MGSTLGKKPADQVTSGQQLANGTVTPIKLSAGYPLWDATGKAGIGALPVSEKWRVQAAADKNFVVDTVGGAVRISGVNDADTLNIPLVIQSSTLQAAINGTVQSTTNSYGIGLGQTVPSSGTGLAFPATQNPSADANTLDDYEEGTWTPTLSSGTFALRSAMYTKIGRQVTVQIWADTLSSTAVIIGGLPFLVGGTCYSPGVAHNNSGNAIVARAGVGSTDIYLRNYNDAGVTVSSLGNFFITTITYFV